MLNVEPLSAKEKAPVVGNVEAVKLSLSPIEIV